MTSKRVLESELASEEEMHRRAAERAAVAESRADRAEHALKRLAIHYGFHDAYLTEQQKFMQGPDHGCPYVAVVDEFDPNKLIADLDTIDQARSADDARKRLGIDTERSPRALRDE